MDLHFALVCEHSHRGTAPVLVGAAEPACSSSLDQSWPVILHDPLFAKEGELSSIHPDCSSDETGSQTDFRNSFRSVQDDCSFYELLTDVVGAMTTECTLFKIHGTLLTEIRCLAFGACFTAKRKLTFSRAYAVLENGREAAEIRHESAGVYLVRSPQGPLARIAFAMKLGTQGSVRLAEVDCFDTPRRLKPNRRMQRSAKDFSLLEDGCEVFSLRKTAAKQHCLKFSQMSVLLAFSLAA